MDLWTFVWVFLSLLLLVTLLESIHRRTKRKRAVLENQILQEQLRSQPYAVYTIQGNGGGNTHIVTHGSHIIKTDDLPPKYEDIINSRTETVAAPGESVLPTNQDTSNIQANGGQHHVSAASNSETIGR